MKRLLKGTVLLSALLVLGACGSNTTTKNEKTEIEQKMNVVSGGELSTLDSGLYTDVYSSDAIGQIMEGLYRVDKDNNAELGLAAEEPEVNDDATVYTYKLRDAKWSNGDPVKAGDFVYAFQNIVDPTYKSPSSNQMDVIKNAKSIREGNGSLDTLGVKAIDEKTLEITLENPIPYLAKLLTGTPFMPKNEEFAKKQGSSYGTSSEAIVTNGPFTISGWNGTNDKWTLSKNKNYWDQKNVKMKEVNVSVVKEVGTGAELFESDETNFTVLSDTYVKQYETSNDFHAVPKALIGYIGFNTQRELFANVHVRKAVAQAIDKESFAKNVLSDGSTALNGLVPNNFATDPDSDKQFREENGNLLSYNVEEAKKEWEEAKKELGKEEITIELLSGDSPSAKKTVEYIQGELKEHLSGLTVNIKSVPIGNRLELNRSGDFDFFFGTWTPDYADPINFLELYESSGGLNFGKYSNTQYDQGIEEVKSTLATDPVQRWNKMLKLEKISIGDDAAVAPIYQGAIAYLQSDNIKGIQVYPFGRQVSYRLAEVTK